MTTTTPEHEPAADQPRVWSWAPDQRPDRGNPRPPMAAGLALVAHRRQLLEPLPTPRQLPSIQLDAAPRRRRLLAVRDEAGQATAEYALVLLGAAAIALLVVSWATKTNLVGKVLDVIFNQLIGKANKGL